MTKLLLRVFEDPRDPGSVYVARRLSGEMAPPRPPAVALGRQRDGSIVARVLPGENMFGVPYAELRQRVGSEFELQDESEARPRSGTASPAPQPVDAVEAMKAHLRSRGIEPRAAEPKLEARPGECSMELAMRRKLARERRPAV